MLFNKQKDSSDHKTMIIHRGSNFPSRGATKIFLFIISSIVRNAAIAADPAPKLKITITDDNEFCRLDLLNDWLKKFEETMHDDVAIPTMEEMFESQDDTTILWSEEETPTAGSFGDFDIESLAAIQETILYQSILEDCQFFLTRFNAAAENTCQRQLEMGNYAYSRFWYAGPINLDGGFLLAADLLLSKNQRESLPLVPCADSCYIRNRFGTASASEDCQEEGSSLSPLLNNIQAMTIIDANDVLSAKAGDKSGNDEIQFQEEQWQTLCGLDWLETDQAYQQLRLCAAESNLARTTIAERDRSKRTDGPDGGADATFLASEVATAYAAQREKQASCLEASKPTCAIVNQNRDPPPPTINSGFGIESIPIAGSVMDTHEEESGCGSPEPKRVTVVLAVATTTILLFTGSA